MRNTVLIRFCRSWMALMSLSPTSCTTKPLAEAVSVTGGPDRLTILDLHTPLNSAPDEMKFLINAAVRVVQGRGFLAIHASRDNLAGTSRSVIALADQAWRISTGVANARGSHEKDVRVYHRPQLFFPPRERKTGWDIIVVSRTRKPRPDAVRGILMQRYLYNDVMDGVFRSTSVPETDLVHRVYLTMFRSLTSVATKRFPLASSWRPADEIAEIDLNEVP